MNCLICGQQHDTTICPDKPIPASPNLFCPSCGYALDGLLGPQLEEAEEEILRLSVLATCHSDERIAAEAEAASLRELLREAWEELRWYGHIIAGGGPMTGYAKAAKEAEARWYNKTIIMVYAKGTARDPARLDAYLPGGTR